jgi:hypothetical protein
MGLSVVILLNEAWISDFVCAFEAAGIGCSRFFSNYEVFALPFTTLPPYPRKYLQIPNQSWNISCLVCYLPKFQDSDSVEPFGQMTPGLESSSQNSVGASWRAEPILMTYAEMFGPYRKYDPI